jgi:predicted transposase YdaD
LAVQEWLDEGRVEGRVEGKMQGKMEGERTSLKTFLELRYPELNFDAAIDSINDLDVLVDLTRRVFAASGAEAIADAIHACVRTNPS